MGTRTLLLLVLFLSSCIFAQEEGSESQNTRCSREATKFKHLKKYTYSYEAATSSGVTGTADAQSGSSFNCKVELEVPQPCNFILRINQCTLREVYGVDSEGRSLFKKAKNSEEFSNAMSKYEVNFSVIEGKQVILYPNSEEPSNVLNMKRGIISSLLVPDETKQTSNMDTVYGKCSSEISITEKKGAAATDISVKRNLKTCDRFTPLKDYVSPIALFKGLNAPLSTLLSSSQTCQYTLEPKMRHIREASCVESHLFLPFSHKNQYGMMAKVTQTLKLESVSKTNNREFTDSSLVTSLALETAEYLSNNGDAVLENLMELQKLSTTGQNQQRANRFHKLVMALRALNNETLGPLVPRLVQLSSPIALQALTQCGTPECFGGILQVLRTGNGSPVLTDTVTYALGLLPSPCHKRVRELLNMAQYQQSRASFYALSHAVNNFYEEKKTITPELRDVADFMSSRLGNDCAGDQDKTFLTLKAVGIMGNVLEEANPQIKSLLLKCSRSQEPSLEVQKAAVQALRKMSMSDEVRSTLGQVFQNNNSPVQKRLAAYLILMKGPSPSDLRKVVRSLKKDDSEQVKNFVASHIVNILNSQAPETQELKGKLEESLKSSGVPSVINDFTKLSHNYQISKTLDVPGLGDNAGVNVEGNIIYDSTGYMPREAMLEATLNMFGQSVDMFGVNIEGKNFEPTLDALFGKGGFFPDCATKALYWVDGKVPDKVTQVLYKWFGVSKDDNQNEDLKRAFLFNVEKLIKEVKSNDAPEAKAYLEILGKELGYVKLSDFKILGNMLLKSFQSTQQLPAQLMQTFSNGGEGDFFAHYIFLDNQFSLPTASGLQLQVALSGIITPGARSGMKFALKNMKAEVSLKPAVAVEFVTQLGVQIPNFSKHAVQMNTNIYHESGVQARFSAKDGQFKFSVPAPTMPTKLFSINNKLNLVFASKTEVMTPIVENREERSSCKPLIRGLEYCTNIGYSNASSRENAPYFPLTGETRYELAIQPTGQVQEYSLTVSHNVNRDGRDLVDTLKVIAQAEGVSSPEALWTVKYNRNKIILTSDVDIPSANVNFGASVRLNDESSDFRRSFTLIAELNNQQLPEVTFTGKLSYDGSTEAKLSGELSIPKLHSTANAEAILRKVLNDYKLQLQSSAQICALSGSQSLAFTYDNEQVAMEWKTSTNSNVKKIISKLPDIKFSDLSNYPETLKGYANDVLDHKVAQTDMTIRHIASQSLVATKNWLQKISKESPYAQTLNNKLSALKEMDLQGLGIPAFPEELFLNSDGRIRYLFNKDSITINIPLPFAGKSSHQVVPRTFKTPSLELETVGLRFLPQEFKIPDFTIPESYQLKVPLLGVLDLSTNINSNYYNWSASYYGGNTSSEIYQLSFRYQMKADSSLDILSYSIDGAAMATYDGTETVKQSFEGSLRHTLLDSSMRISELYNFKSNQWYKGSTSYQAKSVLGFEESGAGSIRSSINNNILTLELDANDRIILASLFANSDLMLLATFDTENGQRKIESNFKFDSSYLKATYKMSGMFLKEAVTMTSTTDLQDGALINTMTVDYRNKQLTLKCDTNGNYYSLIGLNKFELTLSKQMAAIRSEYQANYKRNRFYTLLTGSVNSLGLEFNTDLSFNNQASRSGHKGTLKINMEGLATSATTSVNFNPLMLESEFNAGIGSTGAAMRVVANGRYREHIAKMSTDARVALSELSLSSAYQANIFSVDSQNLLNFRISREGLKFSNYLKESFDQVKLEFNNDLSIIGSVLEFASKFENSLSTNKFHKHAFDFHIKPYTMTAVLNNELQYDALEFINRGEVKLEDFKIIIAGNIRGAFNKDEIKHAYGLSLGNLEANLNTDTIANIQGTSHTHSFTVAIAGLSASLSSNTNIEAKSIRFTNRVSSVVKPFTVTLDCQTNGDGRVSIFGEQAGQLYSKFILKAEPLSFNLVHDYRGSTSHSFGTGNVHETLLDYKVTLLFTPAEQLSALKLKSRINQNTFNQDVQAYNNAESIGIEVSGQTLADLSLLDRMVHLPFARFNPIDSLNLRDSVNSPQEFGVSGYIKYDKNKDMHVISLPFIENISLYFEKIRSALLTTLQALQNSLKDINIDQYVQRYKRALDTAGQNLNDYINNMDIERKVRVAREKIVLLTKEYKISADELQTTIEEYFRWVQYYLQNYLNEIDRYVRENYDLERLKKSSEMLIQRCVEKIKALDSEYKLQERALEMIRNIQALVEKIVVELNWVKNVDELYKIKANLQEFFQQIQVYIQRINIEQLSQNIKELLQSIEISKYVELIKNSMPIKKLQFFIEQVKNLITTQLEEFEISEKINAIIDKLQDIVSTYDIDKKLEFLIEKFIELLNQQKVKETIKTVTDMLNSIDIRSHYKNILTFVDSKIKQVRDYDFKKLIDDVNHYLDIIVNKLRSFNYDKFVEDFNNWIREVTETINQKMKALELPQKAEALRQYLIDVRAVATEYLQQVRDTRMAAVIQWYEDIMTSTVFIEWKTRTLQHLEDARDRIYSMNIKEECQRYLQQVSQAYHRLVIFITGQWNSLATKITDFAEENNIQEWAAKVKASVEEGFVVPEISLGYIRFPAFEVSLRAFRDATFRTPYIIVPFTDLMIQPVEINIRKLKDIEIPTRFTTPEFSILNTYIVPSYVIDLNEIKLKIVRLIDQIMSSDYKWPSPDALWKNVKMSDMGIPEFSIPEIYIPNMQLPEYAIPKLNLENFQIPDIQIPEFQLPKIPHTVSIPTFGKLTSSFKVTSPFFTMLTATEFSNATVSEKTPEMVASLTAEATSMVEALAFTFKADGRISAPLMQELILKETVLFSHRYAKLDHFSEVTFMSNQIQTQIQTKANLNTEKNSANFENSIIMKVQKRITADVSTKYNHRLNIPQLDFSSQVDLQNDIDTTVDIGRISITSSSKGNWRWNCPLFTDDGTHQADVKFNLRGGSIELLGTNRISGKYLKVDQTLNYNSVFLNSVAIDLMSKVESPNIGNSIATLKGSARATEMKAELQATNNVELKGRTTGIISNSFSYLISPFEIKMFTGNSGNLKISFPLKLTGKIDFLNNYDFTLNPSVQQLLWKANGRFNQYKVSHSITLANNEENMEAGLTMNGEANLDFLAIPFSIPEMQVPYISMKTPQVREFSLWEKSGLKKLLTTTRQNFDLNLKLQYQKNKDMHAIPLPLDALFESINTNMKTFNKKFEIARDKTLNLLADSYNQAKVKIDKYKVDNQVNKIPRTFRIPGYTIPFVNIEVSSFSADLPAFGYIVPKEISTPSFVVPLIGFSIPTYKLVLPSPELPILHVPNSLRKLSLPRIKLPTGQNSILIPAMGNLTYDFFFKSNVISLTTSAGIYNQSDISARVSIASTSVLDSLAFNIDATTGLTRKRGLKLATALAMKTAFGEGKHESSISFGKRNVEASVITNARMETPIGRGTFKQELTGNTKSKPTVSSKMSLTYDLNLIYGTTAGQLDHTLSLESLTSYFSLETKTKGDFTGNLIHNQAFTGTFTNDANTYLNSNGLRSSVKLVARSRADGFGTLDLTENLAVEASTSRIYAVWEHTGDNYLGITPLFTSTGQQSGKATFELALWSLLADLRVQISQPNLFIDAASFNQYISLNLRNEKQEFIMNGNDVLQSLILSHNIKLSNDHTNANLEASGTLQGHVDFLKSVILPVYEKSLWDILKFDVTTSADKKQYLSLSTRATYTKNSDGFFYPFPSKSLSDGYTMTFPGLTLPNDLQLASSLPEVQFPPTTINLMYNAERDSKIPFIELSAPQYQITMSKYIVPKTFYNLDFNSLFNKIADIDLPTIEIPRQNIVIPPVTARLPAGIYIPAFGSLSGTVQFSTPIYNLTWTNKLEKNEEAVVGSIDATSSSTLRFLEFDLDASVAGSLNGRDLSIIGQGSLAHVDLSAIWKQEASFNGLRLPRHNVQIDITSPTFTNVQISCKHDENGLSSTVFTPSTGTLGLQIEKDAKTIKIKVYSRSPASPGKDTLILKNEISLKTPERIQNKLNWREDAAQDVLNGLKEKLPKMTDAVYNCVNKYHKEHLGMDIKEASVLMKQNLHSKVSSTYRSATYQIDDLKYQLQSTARGASSNYANIVNNAQQWYRQPDMAFFMNNQEIGAEVYDKFITVIRGYQTIMRELIDAAIEFLKSTRFQLPSQTRKYSGEELFAMGMKTATSALNENSQKIQQLLDDFIQSINDATFKVPGTQRTIEGKQVIMAVKDFFKGLQQVFNKLFNDLQQLSLEKYLQQLKALIQETSQKSEKLIEAIKSRNYQDMQYQAQQMYNDAINSKHMQYLGDLAERMKKSTNQLMKLYQSIYEELSEKIQQLLIYAKALREEYLDPNIVGWSVKYYEIEEKVIELFQIIIDSLKELPSKLGVDVDRMKESWNEYYEQARVLLTNAENKGIQQVRKMSMQIEKNVNDWSDAAKTAAMEHSQLLNAKLHEAYSQVLTSYDKIFIEVNRLIDLVIEKYNTFIEFLNQMLQNIQNSSSEQIKTYVSTRKGELKVDVPHPFDWKSFDEVPQVRSEIKEKSLEIARAVVFDSIDKGSRTWEELQHYIEKQLEEGKLNTEQIIENIKKWKKN